MKWLILFLRVGEIEGFNWSQCHSDTSEEVISPVFEISNSLANKLSTYTL